MSVPRGSDVHFKIRSIATAYRIDIYRMGYYGGAGARLIQSIRPSVPLPQPQPECLYEPATRLVDCATWSVSASWSVPTTSTSGIYFARLVREDADENPTWRADHSWVGEYGFHGRPGHHGAPDPNPHAYGAQGRGRLRNALREPRASHIFFIVRNDDDIAGKLVFQTMDTTWQTYNCWGTTNTYGFKCDSPETQAGSPPPPHPELRAYKASYNRPFATRAYRAVNMPFNSEYPFVRWLERNGFDVVYWSGVDTHRYGGMLSGDLPPAPGDTRGNGEQLPGTAAQPHPSSAHDLRAAADLNPVADHQIGGAKANPTAGEGLLTNLPASVARRLARVEGHLGSMDATASGVLNNRTQYGSTGKQRHETHAGARSCDVGGSVLGVDGSSGRQCTAAEVAARSARQPKLFLSVGHDEYWSGHQRALVTKARENGVHLAFFSGNEMYWRIRYESSMIDGGDYRTIVVYKDSQEIIKLDPAPREWTGTFRDDRSINPIGGFPENEMTGTIFTVNAWRHDALEVPPMYQHHRFWRNTPMVASQATRGDSPAVLLKGILGHEWDEDIDNGHRPAGLQRLSETTIDNVWYLQDEGATFDTGSATHHLTLYRHASGALVFGGGTCQWSWGLDAHHDSPIGVPAERAQPNSLRVGVDQSGPDATIQQATVNLFGDMGVFPANLQRDLVPAEPSTDRQPPACEVTTITTIENGGGRLLVRGTAHDIGGGVVAAVEVSEDGGLRWHPVDAGTTMW